MTPHEIIKFIDLTRLGDHDDWSTVVNLSQKARTEHGSVAALCVWPKFVEPLRQLVVNDEIKIATVINFPYGTASAEQCNIDATKAIAHGADEIDLVIPYLDLVKGEQQSIIDSLIGTKEACNNKAKLKVIIESGILSSERNIKIASELCIEYSCDFIKTSTGKVPVNATLEAAQYILETIKTSTLDIGFKASGGVVNYSQAIQYLSLYEEILGSQSLTPTHFRFGASSLLDDLLSTHGNTTNMETY